MASVDKVEDGTPRWLGVLETARRMGMSPNTVRRMLKTGALTGYKPARKILLDREEVDAAIRRASGNGATANGAHK